MRNKLDALITILTSINNDIKTGNLTDMDIEFLFDAIEGVLDDGDQMDMFGTEGWKHRYLGED